MKQYTVVAILIILATLALYHYQPTTTTASLETVNQPFIDYLNSNAECSKTRQVVCSVNIEKAVMACANSFVSEETEATADIKCV